MAKMTLKQLAEKMKDIDFSMLQTTGAKGITARPMSNNGDVEYDGDAWFFTYEDSDKVKEIGKNAAVATSYQGKGKGKAPGIFVSVEGKAEVVTDRSAMEEHWYDGLKAWFPDGLDTDGIAMIKVHANRIRWWDGENDGEISVK